MDERVRGVTRQIVEEGDDYVVIRETYDLRNPMCPMVVINTQDWKRRNDAVEVVRTVRAPREH